MPLSPLARITAANAVDMRDKRHNEPECCSVWPQGPACPLPAPDSAPRACSAQPGALRTLARALKLASLLPRPEHAPQAPVQRPPRGDGHRDGRGLQPRG